MKTLKDLENDIKKHQNQIKEFLNRKAPRLVANKALQIFNASWDKQGFDSVNGGFKAWEKRKTDNGLTSDSRGTLIGKGSAILRRSLRVIGTPTINSIIIGTNIPYAQIHNEGGTIEIPITDRMRSFFWAKYYESTAKTQKLKGTGKRKLGGKRTNALATTSVAATKWKGLALTKKTKITIVMPQRQFMGESKLLAPAIEQIIIKGFEDIFK